MEWNAYHFVGDTLRDGSPVPPDGETLVHDGPLTLCQSGFHASRSVYQALSYAPGPILCRVHCAGEIHEVPDKLVCSERTIIARIDASDVMWDFARSCVKDVLPFWDAPGIVVEYLDTGRESIRLAAWRAAQHTYNNSSPQKRWEAKAAEWFAEAGRRNIVLAASAISLCGIEAVGGGLEEEFEKRLTRMVNKAFGDDDDT
jgi:hypothetical protein